MIIYFMFLCYLITFVIWNMNLNQTCKVKELKASKSVATIKCVMQMRVL